MSEIEFFSRAASDASFRRAQLDDLRYYKLVGKGLFGFCLLFAVAITVMGGISDGSWDAGSGFVSVMMIVWMGYSGCSGRIAALQVLDAQATANSSRP